RQPGGPCLLHLFSACEHVVNNEADVVNAAEIFPLLAHVRVIALLAGSDGQVQVTITEVDVGAATPPNLCHAEHVLIEGRDLLQVVGGQGYVFDFRHVLSLLRMGPFRDASPPDCTRSLRWIAIARPGSTWCLAVAAGGRSIACDSADIQSRRR